MDLRIYNDEDELAARAAGFIVDAAQKAVAAQGRFTLVLTGGPAEKTYRVLATQRAAHVDWSKTFIFWGDESVGPPDDPNNNYSLAKRSLLDHVPIPAGNVFPMVRERGPETDLADAYARTLAWFFGTNVGGLPPRFDLVLLGLGEDGHMASLFPGAETLRERDAWVLRTPPGTLPPPVDRLTLTFPVINAARSVTFLVSGAAKADAVHDILDANVPLEKRPGKGVQPADGELTWLLDRAAASKLTNIHGERR